MTASHIVNLLTVVLLCVAGCSPTASPADAGIDTTVDAQDDRSSAVEDVAIQDATDVATDTGLGCGPHGTLHGDHCDCDRGYRAQGLTCVAIESCPSDDRNEPNDSVATATRLNVGAMASGRRCAEEVDYFVVRAPMGQRLVVDALFRHADGDLDLLLFEPGRDPRLDRAIARSESGDDDEQLAHRTRVEGDFIVVVTGASAASQAPYVLRARLDP